MAYATVNIPDHDGKIGIQKLLPAIDANFAAVLALNPGTVSVAGTDNEDGTATIALQIQDVAGASISSRSVIRLWVSDTSFGAPNAGAGQTAFAVATGTELEEKTDLADYLVLTTADGAASITLTGADGTYYAMAECNGLAYAGTITITGN